MPRPTGPTSSPAAPSPRVRDFSAPRPPSLRVEFDVRTVYDFVFSLSVDSGTTDDIAAADRRWIAEARAAIGTDVSGAPDTGLSDLAVVLGGLVVDRPEIRTAADLVRLLEAIPAEVVARTILAEDLRDPVAGALAEHALTGDPEAIEAFVTEHLEDHPRVRQELLASLFRDPAAALDGLRAMLEAWLPRFEEVEPRVREMLERDVAMRSDDRRTLAPTDLIERTTGGVRWISEPGVDRVILAPSYFARPYNYVLGGSDWRLFGYPIADAALGSGDPLDPPADVVRLHRALGDPTRLRILRLLRDRDLYLTEIAGLLDLSKPTIKHHLALLRAAGLVTVTEEGAMTYYALRRDRLDAASADLKRFLLA
jgi:DNA-binding transcriptional ArsR family regulator